MAQKLSNAYVDPSQPGSLGGVAKFAKAHGLTQSKARQVLETMLSYTLHKPLLYLSWSLKSINSGSWT